MPFKCRPRVWWAYVVRNNLLKLEDRVSQFVDISAGEFFDFLRVLDEHESGHGIDVVFGGDVLAFIYVHLENKNMFNIIIIVYDFSAYIRGKTYFLRDRSEKLTK